MISANNLCLSFGTQKIFDHISFTLNDTQRVGLVGRNGTGKSTLLAALQNPALLDSGSIAIINNKKMAYMPQEVVLQSDKTILQEALSSFDQLHVLKKEMTELEHRMAIDCTEQMLERYTDLQEIVQDFNEELAIAQTKKMLMGLGFSTEQFDQGVTTLSVGWKMRIVLAKLLLKKADFYLFDEPTNHLDLITKEWFLEFLKRASFGFMIVCHERYFLDELCDYILELELGKGTLYTGNFSKYLVQKEHTSQLLESAYIQQQKEIKQKIETIERFKAKASKAKMAQSMMKAVDKIDRIVLPPQPKSVSFNFPPVKQSGKVVLTVTDVAQRFGTKLIFDHVSCSINRGEKVALIAPNGGGKTTLFNIITGKLPHQQGTVEFGHNVNHVIFAQDQQAALNGNATILDNIKDRCPQKKEQEIRTLLGSFLFKSDDVLKLVKVLSGGEKNRVGMASVLLSDANLLLLDEPTNHLDIPSKEILLKALQQYNGTIVFVSHDRDFVNDLATHVIELTNHGAFKYEGNYDSYNYQKKVMATEQPKLNKQVPAQQATQAPTTNNDQAEIKKRSAKLESKIDRLEKDIYALELRFAEIPYSSPAFANAQAELKKLKEELELSLRAWEELQKQRT